jgi:hypothetical protein
MNFYDDLEPGDTPMSFPASAPTDAPGRSRSATHNASRYAKRKCRCDECRAAWDRHMAQRRADRAAARRQRVA